MIIDEDNYSILSKVTDITATNYEYKWFDAENIDGYISANTMLDMIEDLLYEIDVQKEKIEELKDRIKNPEEPDLYDEWKDRQWT